jgi:hypothetical protein
MIHLFLRSIEIRNFASIAEATIADLKPGLSFRERVGVADPADIARAISWALSPATSPKIQEEKPEVTSAPATNVRLVFEDGENGDASGPQQTVTLERRLSPDGSQEFSHGGQICERQIYADYAEEIGYNAAPLIIDELDLQRSVSANKRRCRRALDRNLGYAHFDRHVELALARLSKSKRDLQRVREVENLLQLELQQRQEQIQEIGTKSGGTTLQAEYDHIANMWKNSALQRQKLENITAVLLSAVKTLGDDNTGEFEYNLGRFEAMLAYLVRMFEVDFIPQLEFENLDDLTTSGLTVMVQKSGMPAGAVTDLPSEQRLFVALLLKIAALCNQEPPLVDLDSLAASGNSGSLNYRRLLGIFAEQRQVICFSRSGSNEPKNLTIGRHGAWQE